MFGFLARECGWDCNFIKKNLTLSQLKAYFGAINKIRLAEMGKIVEGNFHAMATAQGAIKPEDFQSYLNRDFFGHKEDVSKNIDKLKSEGLPIEDTV